MTESANVFRTHSLYGWQTHFDAVLGRKWQNSTVTEFLVILVTIRLLYFICYLQSCGLVVMAMDSNPSEWGLPRAETSYVS